MMDKIHIEKDLIEYRNLTLELFNRIKINGDRLYILKKREDIIDKIKNSNYDKVELAEIYEKLEINRLDKQLEIEVSKEMFDLKKKLHALNRSRQGNKSYIANVYGRYIPSRFDKKY